MKFSLSRNTIYSPDFDAQLERFILDTNPGTVAVDLWNVDAESQKRCFTSFQKIVNERQSKIALSIDLSSPHDVIEAIFTMIEGNPHINQLDFKGSPAQKAVDLITNALTQSGSCIEALSFEIGPNEVFSSLAQALRANRTLTQLKITYSMLFHGWKVLNPIFQALTNDALDEDKNAANSSVQALHLKRFDISSEADAKALNLMLEKNHSISDFEFTDSDTSDFFKLKSGLVKNTQLLELSLKGCFISADDLPKMASCLPPRLKVLNLSNLKGFVRPRELIEDLMNLIKECQTKNLSLHIIFNGNHLASEIGFYREDLKELLLSSGNDSNVSLECDALTEIMAYKRNQCVTFFEVLAKAYDETMENQYLARTA